MSKPDTTEAADEVDILTVATHAIRASVNAVWRLVITGHHWPAKDELASYMRQVEVGQMVVESSTIHVRARDCNAVGKLLRVVREPVFSSEEWGDGGGGDEPIPTETVYYIQTLDGREFRWVNASFLPVPMETKNVW